MRQKGMCVYLNVERSIVNCSSEDEESRGKMGQCTLGAQVCECSTVANLLLNVFQGKKKKKKKGKFLHWTCI